MSQGFGQPRGDLGPGDLYGDLCGDPQVPSYDPFDPYEPQGPHRPAAPHEPDRPPAPHGPHRAPAPHGPHRAPGPHRPPAPDDLWRPVPWEPRPTAARRRHWTWIVPLIVAVLVIGLFSYIAVHDPFPGDARTSGRQLSLPARVDEYVQLRSYDTGTIKDRLASVPVGLGDSGDALAEFSVVGAYATSVTARSPQLVFVAIPLFFVPTLADQVHDLGTTAVVRQVMAGATVAGSSVHEVDPGRLGGAMSCVQVTQLGASVGLCAWADRSYLALTIVQQPRSADDVQQVALDLRTVAER